MKYITLLLLLFSTAFTFAQKAKMIGAQFMSLPGTHESLSYAHHTGGFIVFTRANQDFSSSTIYASNLQQGNVKKPRVVPFSGEYYDAGYDWNHALKTAFFTSKRPTGLPGSPDEWNLWKVKMHDGKWLDPKPISELNSAKPECCLTINDDGNALFASKKHGSWDIFKADWVDGIFTNVGKMETISSEGDEWPSYISNEQDVIIFSSTRPGGVGGDDLYYAIKQGEDWSTPRAFNSNVNTSSYEDSGFISRNGKYLYFASWRDQNGNQDSNAYRIKLRKSGFIKKK